MESGSAEIEDYEGLPENIPASTHMIAGATAGITEHCIMYPIDCVKTRMQALNPNTSMRYTGIWNAMKTITLKEGFGRTFHGMPAVIVGAGPAHALYFACYEKLKWILSEKKQSTLLATFVAGGCATLFHDGIMVPADVVKQRMQMCNSPFKNSWDCAETIMRTEGVRAFYRSYTTQLAMNIPFQTVHFTLYEQTQNMLNYEREYNPLTHIISGAIAGSVAALVTNPFDVCKTLLNTQEICCHSGKAVDRGFLDAAKTVITCRGWSGFFRGAQARMVFQMPSAAISWSVYEFFKYVIAKRNSDSSVNNLMLDSGNLRELDDIKKTSNSMKPLISPVYANDGMTPISSKSR